MQYIHYKGKKFPAAVVALNALFLCCLVLYCHSLMVVTASDRGTPGVSYKNSVNQSTSIEPFHLFLRCIQQGQ